MNDRQIAFIMCVNDDRQADESEFYIRCLEVPEQYEVDVIRVREAESMTAGYNAAMENSDARYKVYLHQDTRIIAPGFIRDMINVFKNDDTIGMLGCVGCRKLPANGQAVGHWDVGMVYHNCIPGMLTLEQDKEQQPVEVEALDGLLLATSRDVRWREDLFDGWDFYDVSQCLEMRRMGWRVVVPCQETPWCYHDNFYSRMLNYQKYCNKMITEYQDIQSFQAMDYSESRKELEHPRGQDEGRTGADQGGCQKGTVRACGQRRKGAVSGIVSGAGEPGLASSERSGGVGGYCGGRAGRGAGVFLDAGRAGTGTS